MGLFDLPQYSPEGKRLLAIHRERMSNRAALPERYHACVNGTDETGQVVSDCAHLMPAISWWCTNQDAHRLRMTSIPGCTHCPFWQPKPNPIRWFARWFGWAFLRS